MSLLRRDTGVAERTQHPTATAGSQAVAATFASSGKTDHKTAKSALVQIAPQSLHSNLGDSFRVEVD